MASKAGEAAAGAAKQQMTRFARNPYWATQRKQVIKTKSYHRNLARAGGAKNEYGQPLFTPQSWPIVTGDLVQVTSTSRKRDKDNRGKQMKNSDGSYVAEDWLGAQGKVLRVLRRTEQIIVQGINIKTRIAQVRTPPQQCHRELTTWSAVDGGSRAHAANESGTVDA